MPIMVCYIKLFIENGMMIETNSMAMKFPAVKGQCINPCISIS